MRMNAYPSALKSMDAHRTLNRPSAARWPNVRSFRFRDRIELSYLSLDLVQRGESLPHRRIEFALACVHVELQAETIQAEMGLLRDVAAYASATLAARPLHEFEN